MQKPKCRYVRSIEAVEEEWLLVDHYDLDPVGAVRNEKSRGMEHRDKVIMFKQNGCSLNA